jgi:glycerol kinase
MLMDLKNLHWDDSICKLLNIPKSILPTIKSSSEVYGTMSEGPLKGIPISGVSKIIEEILIASVWVINNLL